MNTKKNTNSPPDFLVHDAIDSVGVVVVEQSTAGQILTGWIMDSDETITIEAIDDIPLGHKIALNDLADGDQVIKYGFPIGRTVAVIPRGAHLHVHNTKTEKW